MDLKDFNLIYKENRVRIKDKDKIKSILLNILGESNFSDNPIDLLAYSKDATLIGHNWTLEGKVAGLADFITWPESKVQICEILKMANEEKIPIIPYGEGSGVVGGAIPVRGGIIIDMKKFNKILNINDMDLTVTVETGMNGMNLERELNLKGFTSGHIPQSLYTSSVGGWIAHKAAGQFSTKYGKIEDILLGMEIILPQAEIINFKPFVRNATGPQMGKFFIGNEGILGIVTEATLRIWPYPQERRLISYAFPNFEASLEAVRLILREQIYPAVIRIYDEDETKRHFSHIQKAIGRVMVVFICEGNNELVQLEEKITRDKCMQKSGIDCGEEPVKHWFETRFKVTETSSSPQYNLTIDTIEVAVSWENAARMYHHVLEKVKAVKGIVLFTAHVSHFYPNGVGMYFSFGGIEMEEKSNFEFYQKIWNTTMEAVLESGGSIAHHHGIGINRANWMDNEWGKSITLLRNIKKILDPNNIFNPGKVLESSWKGGND
ncbi:MAG: FAD-binding oxidoreductase [Candidatus Thorarchaeota archaeon]